MKWIPLNEHRLTAEVDGEWEHLMQQGDHIEPDTAHIDAVSEAIHNMDDSMRDVLLAIFYEQVPFSELGERLGCSKTQAWRKAKQAIAAITPALINNKTIQERYNVHTTWDSAAKAAMESMESFGDRPADIALIDFCARDLKDGVNAGKTPPSYAFTQIGIEAIHELKHRNLWHPQAFLRMLCSKQADYGHGNINAFGLVGIAVRLHDKIARLHNLTLRDSGHLNEPLLDTWLDMIGYAVIAEMLYNGTFNLELDGLAA